MFIYLVVLVGVNCFRCDHFVCISLYFFVDRKCLPRIHNLTLVVRYMYAYKVGACARVCLFILTRKFGHSFGISVAKRSINVIK